MGVLSLPESFILLSDHQIVPWVLSFGLTEGWNTIDHGEKDDSTCEQINIAHLVGVVTFEHFWRLIAFSANLSLHKLIRISLNSKAKVDKLEQELVIEHNVVKLEISMVYIFIVTESNSTNELLEVVACKILFHRASIGDEVKELTS